ncbi:MAG: hypothetical protein ACYDBB_19270 [Armatimonadota bacterium]
MRCEEKTGFLMLRHCGNVSETVCVYCGKQLCSEHTFALTETQLAALPQGSQMGRPLACLECFRQQQQGAQPGQPGQQPVQSGLNPQQQRQPWGRDRDPYSNDPYYHYPYYGSYHPYFWGDSYGHRDRNAFHNSGADAGTTNDATGS